MYDPENYQALIGATIGEIWISEDRLTFNTDRGFVSYWVDGDCCSHSYFFDFHGVYHLLTNGPVTAFEAVELGPGDPGYHVKNVDSYEDIKVYGYRLTTDHQQFGPVSSVFSFRNSSNGYYGGSMEKAEGGPQASQRLLVRDVLDVEKFLQGSTIAGELASKSVGSGSLALESGEVQS
ncbi:DUF7448 domain-containing protein [Kineosporia babensis]|uniref:Uncharacterized protein n=1 Tax=Kineosporia babensis TaxID=499548 RepID=A0A9X1STT9_9ACTN|nr:hypothetical protein [Kineosporia babensis]MCD5310900.1 hypothetical protein [Kineosporia babensis]